MAKKFIDAMDASYPRYSDDEAFMQEYSLDWTRKEETV